MAAQATCLVAQRGTQMGMAAAFAIASTNPFARHLSAVMGLPLESRALHTRECVEEGLTVEGTVLIVSRQGLIYVS